ncbi:MAG: HNH endonuclease [Lachnospiraceae bacterium]|nr:HNH endonuclease [Lachnospiraceae bacterium]
MGNTKKRRDVEIYENYWKFTAAHLDITGTKFNNCLNLIVLFIDKNKKALEENAKDNSRFSDSELYKVLQQQIVDISGFKGSDATLSARKAINQFVKIGFIYPLLVGYHPLVKTFILETNKEKKKIIFSKIFYESSSLASDVTLDHRDLKHVNFLLKTLDKNVSLNKNDIMALMVTDISNYSAGYLTREQLDLQYQYAKISEFDERKYNQIAHLIGYLKRFVDLKYDKNEERFWFASDPLIANKDFDESYARDGVRHRIYKEELKEESKSIYGDAVCYLDKKPYKSLIASHIKPCADCLKEHREDQAYDVNNGLLLSPTVDSYFDKKDISFADDGTVLVGKKVAEAVRADFEKLKLDKSVLNEHRRRYLAYHRCLFEQKNGEEKNNGI